MGVFKLGGMTLKSLFKKAPTRKYPYEVREPYARTRAAIDMTDIDTCIFCGMCERACPADSIVVDKKATTWTYWPFKCIACDSCVRNCPKDILFMVGERPAVSTSNDGCVVLELSEAEKAERERIAAEKKAKALAAKKAKEAKEAAEAAKAEGNDA